MIKKKPIDEHSKAEMISIVRQKFKDRKSIPTYDYRKFLLTKMLNLLCFDYAHKIGVKSKKLNIFINKERDN